MTTHGDGCEDSIIPTLLALDKSVKKPIEGFRVSFHSNSTHELDLLGVYFRYLRDFDGVYFRGSAGCRSTSRFIQSYVELNRGK